MNLPTHFSYIHIFAANSMAGILNARRIANDLNEFEIGAPRQLNHILEGDLNWIGDGRATVPYLWHPTWFTRIPNTWEAVKRKISSGHALLLEKALESLDASEYILLDIKQGNRSLESAMHVVDECLQSAEMQERTYIVSYSPDTLRQWGSVLPYAKRVLHTFVMAGRLGLKFKLGPSWIDILHSVRFSDVLESPHVDIIMLTFPSALTKGVVRRMVSLCVSSGKQFWAGNLHSTRSVLRTYLGGAHGGNIWSDRAARKTLMSLQNLSNSTTQGT